MNTEELWKPISALPLGYEISNFGNVRIKWGNGKVDQCMLQNTTDGYKTISACGKQLRIHQLVAEAFIPHTNPLATIVNHKDRNKSNNCVDNLEWVTLSENIMHQYATGHSKTIYCVERDELYGTMSTAVMFTGIPSEAIKHSITTGSECFGYHFKYAPFINRPDAKYLSSADIVKLSKRYKSVAEAIAAVKPNKYI